MMTREEIEQGFVGVGWAPHSPTRRAMEEEKQTALIFYCECGHKMWCELRRLEEGLGAMAFFDEEEASKTYAERVDRCPGCGRRVVAQILAQDQHTNR